MATKPSIEDAFPGVPWKTVHNAHAKEFDALAKAEGFLDLDIEDCRHRRQLAKVIERSDYTFIVAKIIRFEGRALRLVFDDLDLFVKSQSLVMVEENGGPPIERVKRRLADPAVRRDTGYIVYAILDEIVDEYLLALDQIGETVNALEAHVWKDPTPYFLQRIFSTKRALIDFRRNAAAMREVASSLLRLHQTQGTTDLSNYYRDLYEHLIRVIEFIETYRDLLTGALDIYLSAVANRTNDTVKVLTVYGTVALPLIIITGFYGMNIELPLQRSPHAALSIGIVMFMFTAGMLWYFRKKNWF